MADRYDNQTKAGRKQAADAYFATQGYDTAACQSLAEVFETFPDLAAHRDQHRQTLQARWAELGLNVE